MKVKSRHASKALKDFLQGSSILTSNQKQNLVRRMSGEKPDYHNWWIDWKLTDAYQRIFSDIWNDISEGLTDHKLTKMFYCRSNMLDNIDGFLGPEAVDHSWNENVRAAVRVVRKQVKANLQPIILRDESQLELLWSNKNASAGAIGRGTKAENARGCFETALKIKDAVRTETSFDRIWIPAIGFHRAQISGFINDNGQYDPSGLKEKDRLVYGLDGGTVTVEAQYAVPVIQHLTRTWKVYAGGKSPSDLRRMIRGNHSNWTSIDYSKFDQTIPSWLISLAFKLIKEMFDADYQKELDWIEYNFIHTRLVFNGGVCVTKHHGIPSGSNFTQVIGSMVNAIMMYAYFASLIEGSQEDKETYINGVIRTMLTMGDDNLTFTTCDVDLDDMAGYVRSVFGVVINASKSGQGDRNQPPEFLKREWRDVGEYQKPQYFILNTVHPENDRKYDDYSPWHIIYGMYLTYTAAFPRTVEGQDVEVFIVKQMQSNGGVSAIVNMDPKALPGVFRAYGRLALEAIYRRAERVVRVA